MKKMKITLYSHFFKVTKIHPSTYLALRKAIDELVQRSFVKIRGKWVQQSVKVFAARTTDGSEYRFHINYLPRFKEIIRGWGIKDDEIDYEECALFDTGDVVLKTDEMFVLRDYQQACIEYMLEDGSTKLITLQTGKGKGFTSMKFGEIYGKRIFVTVLARYKEKWIQELKEIYGEEVNIVSIDTLVQFLQLLEKHEENKEGLPDVFIVSTSIMQRYISEWEKHQGREIEGMIPPEQIYERLDIGYRLIDEAHQHFHFVFKNDLYTHCAKCVYLTATLNSNERFLNAMYELVWPTKIRTKTLAYEAYDNVIALYYQHNAPERVRCKGQQGYSHILYEQSIFRHIPSQCQYLDMIGDQVEQHFLPIYDEGKRMLIFCSLVDTCEKVSSYLNKRFKDQKWKISKFVAGDNKEIIDTNDITVSTLGKAGTALDIDGLVVVLNTVALSEPKANIQAKGRNRNLTKRPGFEHITPKFIYFVGTDIPKHIEYHRAKRRLFAELTLAQYEQSTGYTIGIPLHEYLPRYGDNSHRYDMWGVKPYESKKK